MRNSVPKYLRVISDIHLDNWAELEIKSLDTDPETILLLAGDLADSRGYDRFEYMSFFNDVSRRFNHVYYVLGNHEHCGTTYPDKLSEFRQMFDVLFDNHITLLDHDVVRIPAGDREVILAGMTLWTNFNNDDLSALNARDSGIPDFKHIQGFTTEVARRENILACSFLRTLGMYTRSLTEEQAQRTDLVIMSHFAPLRMSAHAKFGLNRMTDYFCNDHSKLMAEIGIRGGRNLWVHGHTHSYADYSFEPDENVKWRVCNNPVGYWPEGTDYLKDWVIPLDNIHDQIKEVIPARAEGLR